jgi:hypothetical protein
MNANQKTEGRSELQKGGHPQPKLQEIYLLPCARLKWTPTGMNQDSPEGEGKRNKTEERGNEIK